jgi:adenylate cyclase
MGETRKIAAILCADVVGYGRLAGADEDRILRSPSRTRRKLR